MKLSHYPHPYIRDAIIDFCRRWQVTSPNIACEGNPSALQDWLMTLDKYRDCRYPSKAPAKPDGRKHKKQIAETFDIDEDAVLERLLEHHHDAEKLKRR